MKDRNPKVQCNLHETKTSDNPTAYSPVTKFLPSRQSTQLTAPLKDMGYKDFGIGNVGQKIL